MRGPVAIENFWKKEGVDFLFAPAVEEMYSPGAVTYVMVDCLVADKLCGATCPGHFRGLHGKF